MGGPSGWGAACRSHACGALGALWECGFGNRPAQARKRHSAMLSSQSDNRPQHIDLAYEELHTVSIMQGGGIPNLFARLAADDEDAPSERPSRAQQNQKQQSSHQDATRGAGDAAAATSGVRVAASAIENRAREVGMAIMDPATMTLHVGQFIEPGRYAATAEERGVAGSRGWLHSASHGPPPSLSTLSSCQ